MIVTEFARKYDIPLSTVRICAVVTKTKLSNPRESDIPERELINEVKKEISRKVNYYQAQVDKNKAMLDRLTR